MRIHIIQHVSFETPAALANWCTSRGHTLQCSAIYQDGVLPEQDSFDMLILLGGPMHVYESSKYPWLDNEIKAIKDAILAEKKVFGICLGAQLIAVALDAQVTNGPFKEIGWYPVTHLNHTGHPNIFKNIPNPFDAFHWHSDTFQIPKGAYRIAESAACPNQAFQYEKHVLAIQFHLETNEQILESLIEHCPDDLREGPWTQDPHTMQSQTAQLPGIHQSLFSILDLFTKSTSTLKMLQ